MLARVRAEFVQNEAKVERRLRRKKSVRPRERDARVLLRPERELISDQLCEIGAGPRGLRQQRMGTGERVQAALEARGELLRRLRSPQGLARDRLHRRERILDPMIELAEQQLLRRLNLLALGDVEVHAEHASCAIGTVGSRQRE